MRTKSRGGESLCRDMPILSSSDSLLCLDHHLVRMSFLIIKTLILLLLCKKQFKKENYFSPLSCFLVGEFLTGICDAGNL